MTQVQRYLNFTLSPKRLKAKSQEKHELSDCLSRLEICLKLIDISFWARSYTNVVYTIQATFGWEEEGGLPLLPPLTSLLSVAAGDL